MNDAIVKAGEEATERDPRQAPYGFYSGGSFVMDSVRVFNWFESVDALADFLLEVEPAIFDIEGEDLEAYRVAVMPILQQLKADGFSDELLAAFNEAVKDALVMDWWGEFDELTAGETEFAQGIVSGFVGASDDVDEDGEVREPTSGLAPDQLDEFVEYLKTCGC